MPIPTHHANRYANPSYSSSGVNRRSVLSATPQQKLQSNFNTLSCNSKYVAMSCNSKFVAMSERKHQLDLRPLADSKYHQQCIEQILDFCSRNNYPIARKESLNFMSTTEMEKLFTFILSFYEIKIKQNALDIEIPRVMESLAYPYSINKTSLRSFTTPKAKGVVLSMMIFLIEPLMSERISIFANREDDHNLEVLRLMLSRHQEEKDNFIKQRRNQQLMKKNELEALIKKTEELKNESNSLNNQDDQLKQLRESEEFLAHQLQDFKSYEENMRTYVESSSQENDELRKKIEQTENEIRNLNDRKLDLENQIKEQAHSVDEMNYYIQRDKQVQIEIHKMNEELKKARQEYFQEKLKQDELFDNLKELFFKLTNIMRAFKTDLPDVLNLNNCLKSEKYSDLIVFLNNPDLDQQDSKFSLDVYSEFLKSLKQALNNDLLDCKEKICKCQSELESSLTRSKQLEKKNEMFVEQKQNVIQDLESKKLDLINQIKSTKNEIEEVKSEIQAINTDVKLKRKIAMNENLDRKAKSEETKKEFDNHWASIKAKTVNLESQLKSVLPLNRQFEIAFERGQRLNAQLDEHLNEQQMAIDKL